MSDALDMSIEAMTPEPAAVTPPTDPWLARRMHGFGASDVPALLVGLGRRAPESVPGYIASNAKSMAGYPRIVLEKAGKKRPLSVGTAARLGTARERELLDAWTATLGPGSAIVAESVTHASSVPRWIWPLVDRECARLAVTLDAWCQDVLGDKHVIECKCSVKLRDVLPWYWRAQIQAQLAATGHPAGLLVCGQEWGQGPASRGPIEVWRVERDEHEIAEIREAVCEGWAMVTKARTT